MIERKQSLLAVTVHHLRRLPPPVALIIGVCIGVLYSHWSSSSSSPPPERWSGPPIQHPYLLADQATAAKLPNIAKRERLLKLLTGLTPHYTKQCTRNVQPLYVDQALKRYTPLIGHKAPISSSWLGNLGLTVPDADMGDTAWRQRFEPQTHKYFFAINLYNSFDVIPDLFSTLFRAAAILGYHNVFVSIYENGSTDQTKALLVIFEAITRTLGMRVQIRQSKRTRGLYAHRIEYLAEVRNAAMVPFHERREGQGEYFDTVIFMNDILPCVDDLLELIWQSRQNNAGITCAADYMYHDEIGAPVFYDNWVARDINGTALENAPFEAVFHHPPSASRFQRHLPVQVQSCWNGIAVLDPAPLYLAPPVKFRMAHIQRGECSASECSLVCNDYWASGYGRILMVPRVKLAYDRKVWDIIHPPRRNLTMIRGYVRLGGMSQDDPRTDPQDRSWFGPHDRLFVEEESEPIVFQPGPESVWCWGWDGAGELEGPDVDPIWESVPNKSTGWNPVQVRHNRAMELPIDY